MPPQKRKSGQGAQSKPLKQTKIQTCKVTDTVVDWFLGWGLQVGVPWLGNFGVYRRTGVDGADAKRSL